jgi:predicted ATPase
MKLGARAFDVLVTLIERRDRLVTKSELLDAVWGNQVVEESNLTVQISMLRKALGPDVIATIPGRGYRFVAASSTPQSTAGAVASVSAFVGSALRTNLPEVLPELIGRDDDLVALSALLDSRRLITIVGAGGMGKTRLAERLLHDRRAAYEQGVAWVELAGLSDRTLLPSAIAGALGLQSGGGDPLLGLVSALKPLRMAVCLDNAEHLIDEVASVAQAIHDGAPEVRVVVTSQTPLQLPIERVYRLGALAVPDGDVPLDEALSFGAIALFVERASAADRHFRVGSHNIASVIELCLQLDGLALAIELAATRVSMLGVSGLVMSLGERLRILTQGRRGAPQRQRTLREALEWSHGLLSAGDAVVFRRLGVFAGSFSLESARQVVADDQSRPEETSLDEWQVTEILGTLIDRSLVSVDSNEPPRYRLLESARAYAKERLAQCADLFSVQRLHAREMLELFRKVELACRNGLLGIDQAVAHLSSDLDNARDALAWFLANDADGAVAMAVPLSFALTATQHQERTRVWESTAQYVNNTLADAVRAGWAVGCSAHWQSRRSEIALSWAYVGVDFYRRVNEKEGLYRALGMVAGAAARLTRHQEAWVAYTEMGAIEDPMWSARTRFVGAHAGSVLARLRGEFDSALRDHQRMRVLAELSGDSLGAQNAMAAIADDELAAGKIGDAVRHGIELEHQLRGTRHLSALAYARVNLCGALLAAGSLEAVREIAGLAWAMALQFDLRHAVADYLSLLSMLEGRPRSAARLRGYSNFIYESYGSTREPNEADAAERTDQLVQEQLHGDEYAQLQQLGSRLGDAEILPLALSRNDSGSAAQLSN